MLENLRIAVRKQRKLVLIFLLTILLPALTLSIFGIRAIRNERFRLAKQEENEGRRAARFIRTYIQSKIDAIARALDETAKDPAFLAKDRAAIRELAEKRIASNPLSGQVVLLYRNETASFPLLQLPAGTRKAESPNAADASLAARRQTAGSLEFVDGDYRAAAALYRELSSQAAGRDLQAEMLTGQARCLQKAEDYREAVRVCARIASAYPDSLTPSGVPLGLLARLQAVECYRLLRTPQEAAKSSLDAYRELLKKPTALSEDQFKTYISLVEEAFDTLLASDGSAKISEEIRTEYADLKKLQAVRLREWEVVGLIRKELVPELTRRLALAGSYSQEPYRLSRNIEGRDLLLLATWIPDRDGKAIDGVFGVQLNKDQLSDAILKEARAGAQLDDGAEVVLADLAGRPLSGRSSPTTAPPLATEYLEDGFPPWKIELFQAPVKGPGILDLRRNFYFWTILTLVVVLAFGAFLIVRTITHEMEILKIKSDFVSSVSHEFKTPLTSIRSLMERLIDGKVRDPAKMGQYFAIIAQDTDRLTRLVSNLLDFSKIEEGKKEYTFAETDVARLAAEQVEAFKKDQVQPGPTIRLEIDGEIPAVRADAEALSRALANLLGNAAKFTPAGRSIRAGLRKEGGNVVFEVEDEGIGIHPDEIGKVFEKFFQGRNAHDLSARGTGLGLTIVKHIAEAHGGRVLVESQVGRGSKFTLVLPIGS